MVENQKVQRSIYVNGEVLERWKKLAKEENRTLTMQIIHVMNKEVRSKQWNK